MKHAFLCALAMAACLIAPPTHAQLQWLGPLPHATKTATTPKPPGAPPRTAQRQIDDNDILTSMHKGLPLELVVKDNQAKVCQLKSTPTTVCAVIEAPLPPDTTVKLWNLPNGTIALSYMRSPGVKGAPDPDGKAARRFQAAFNGAARAVLAYHGSSTFKPSVDMACTNEDCSVIEGGGGGGGGGGGSGGGGGGGGGVSGGESGTIAVVEVHGKPEPVSEIPTVVVTGHYDPSTDFDPSVIPTLPPPDHRDDLAELTNPCIISPIATVCIIGKRPPVLPNDPPLPTGNPPIFPQWACEFVHILCTRGQEPIDAESLPPDLRNPAWPTQHKFGQCIKAADVHLQFCKGIEGKASYEEVSQCLDNVIAEYNDCFLLYGPNPNP